MCLMKKDQCHLYFGLTNAEDRTKIMKGDAIMKRKIMAVLLAAAMTGSLAGCGSTSSGEHTEQKCGGCFRRENESSNVNRLR